LIDVNDKQRVSFDLANDPSQRRRHDIAPIFVRSFASHRLCAPPRLWHGFPNAKPRWSRRGTGEIRIRSYHHHGTPDRRLRASAAPQGQIAQGRRADPALADLSASGGDTEAAATDAPARGTEDADRYQRAEHAEPW